MNTVSKSSQFAIGVMFAAIAFFTAVLQWSQGWGLPIAAYILMTVSIFDMANKVNAEQGKQVSDVWKYAINVVGCSLLVSALWFSGRLAQGF